MSSDNSIISSNAISKIKVNMRKLKEKSKNLNSQIENIIDRNTKSEKENLEKALKIYNKKLQDTMNSKQVKDKMNEKYECEEDILELLNKVKSAFRKAIRQIKRQDTLSSKEKQEKIKILGEAIEDALLSKDEKKIMETIKQQLGNLPYNNVRLLC